MKEKACKNCQIYPDCTQIGDANKCGMYWGNDEKLNGATLAKHNKVTSLEGLIL